MQIRSFVRAASWVAASFALGCESPPSGELFDAALLSDGRVAVVGYVGLGDLERPSVTLLDADGREQWVRYLGSAVVGGLEVGTANRVVVDELDRIHVAGFARTAAGVDAGIVVSYDADGDFLWETRPFTAGDSEIRGLAASGGDVFVTGYARGAAAPGEFPPVGVLTARLRGTDGWVLWSDVLDATPDPLGVTTGLHVAVGPAGQVGVAGCATAADGHSDWLAAVWGPSGQRAWQSRRRGPDDRGQDAGDLSVAVESAFGDDGGLYVAGTIFAGSAGSDAELVKYAGDGDVEWVRSFGAALPEGVPSYDRADALEVVGDEVVYGGARAAIANDWLIDESFVATVDLAGAGRWEHGFPGAAQSGEEVFDLAADAAGDLYVAGTISDRGYGKDLAVMKLTPTGEVIWSEALDGVGSALDLDRIERLLARDETVVAVGKIDWGFGAHVATAVKLDPVDGSIEWAFPETLHGNQKIHVVR